MNNISNNVVIRKDIDRMLLSLIGRVELVEQWWNSPNKSFDDQTPYSVYLSGEDGRLKVYNYVAGFCWR